MKCDQANTWLLMSDSPAEPPEQVARHLEACQNCREMQRQLVQLECDIATEVLPPKSDAAKQRFLSGLDQLPDRNGAATTGNEASLRTPDLGKTRATRNRRTVAYVCSVAAALIVMFVGGWVLSTIQHVGTQRNNTAERPYTPERIDNAPQVTHDDPKAPQPLLRPARPDMGLALLDRLINNHLRLAAAEAPAERFALVADLSDVLWQEIVQQVETRPTVDLLRLSQFYLHVVGDALPSRSHALAPVDQPARQRIASVLIGRRTVAQRLAADSVPAVVEVLQRISNQTDAAAQWIARGELPQDDSGPSLPVASDLLTSVLASNLRLAEEDDPLQRARQSSEVADQLSQTIVFTSLSGDADTSEQLGEYLGDVVDRGVMVNLARFEPAGEDDPRLADYEQIKQRGQRAIEVLRRNLERAPEAARKGLERALEAKQRGHGKGKGPPHGKGKGKGNGEGDVNRQAPEEAAQDTYQQLLLVRQNEQHELTGNPTRGQRYSPQRPVHTKGNKGIGNGIDPPPPGNPPVNDGFGTSPGNPGRRRR